MRIFDRIRLQDLERRNMQLWVLAIGMILVLAGGLALHMYALAFPADSPMSRRAMLQGMIGFGALALLFVGYLIDRQVVIAKLRRELEDERKRNVERRTQGSKELLATLSGPGQFCERLALELQRATDRQTPLSGLTILLEVSPDLAGSEGLYSAFGEAVKAMINRLRGEDSIYQFAPGVFAVLLPGAGAEPARRVAVRVADALNEAMGASKRYSFDIHVTNFPDQAKTAPEMEKLMHAPSAR